MLSAFLIFRIRAKTANQFSYADFYRQRFFRIYPTFLVSLLMFCWFCTLYMKWYPFEAGMFFQNLVFLNGCPGLGVRSFNMVTWSLFYESFFYLVFPLLFLGIHQARTGNPQKQFLAAALLLVAILFFYTWLVGVGGEVRGEKLQRHRLAEGEVVGPIVQELASENSSQLKISYCQLHFLIPSPPHRLFTTGPSDRRRPGAHDLGPLDGELLGGVSASSLQRRRMRRDRVCGFDRSRWRVASQGEPQITVPKKDEEAGRE